MKVWEMDGTDIVRFEITRDQWNTLIKAIAGAAAWASPDRSQEMWDALDVLREAEDVVDTTAMQNALKSVRSFAKVDDHNGATYQRIVDHALEPITA